jgi:cytochrome c
MKLKALSLGLIAAGTLTTGQMAMADDDAAKLFEEKICHTCHGPNGHEPTAPMYPKIACQDPAYSLPQMKDIRDGTRANNMAAVMKPSVMAVTDDEFAAIADWLANQEFCQ